jgi:hypothetical protein
MHNCKKQSSINLFQVDLQYFVKFNGAKVAKLPKATN